MRLPRGQQVQRALLDLRARLTKDDLLVVLLIGHGTLTGRRRRQVQPGRPRHDRKRVGGPAEAAVRPPRIRRHDIGQLPVHAEARGARPYRSDGDGFDRAGIRDGLRGVVRQGADRNVGRQRQERPRVDDRGVHVRERGGPPVVRRAQPAPDRASAASTTMATVSGARRRARAPTDCWRAARTCRPPGEPVDAPRRALAARQAALEAQVEALKARRSSMAPDAYQAELERLLLELARISAELRSKT